MNKKIIYIVILVIVAVIGFFIFRNKGGLNKEKINESDVSESAEDLENGTGKVEDGQYKNDTFGFSLKLSKGMSVSSFNENNGTIIMIKGAGGYQMQIFVSSFDENITLTSARIKKDIPSLNMIDPIEIKTDGVGTVAFYSNDTGEKKREIWFVHGGFLFQILAKASDDNLTGAIMEGWKWNK